MMLRLLATSLTTTLLLVSTLGCAKKDDLVSPVVTMGSYNLDGKTITCQVKATGRYATGSGHTGLDYDYLFITLTTTPEPASSAEKLEMDYNTRTNSSTVYSFNAMYFYTSGHAKPDGYFNNNTTGTLTVNQDGTVSGTFAAQTDRPVNVNPVYLAVTAGSFTNVRP